MADPQTDTPQVDAVLCAQTYPPGVHGVARALALKAEFGPVLGATRVHARHVGGAETLVTREASGVYRYHAHHHPRAGEERYAWTDRGDGVLYGVLNPEAKHG
jgi:hypothetical protein